MPVTNNPDLTQLHPHSTLSSQGAGSKENEKGNSEVSFE